MKKLTLLLVILFVFYASVAFCAQGNDYNELLFAKNSDEATSVIYEQDWETVYNAVSYVWRHSERSCIKNYSLMSVLDFAKVEKAIYAKQIMRRSTKMAFFFEPLRENLTKVYYVTVADGASLEERFNFKCYINTSIEEVAYFLKHDLQEYHNYTYNMQVEKEKEQEQRLNY